MVFPWGTKIPTIHLLERSDSVEENSEIVLAATPWAVRRGIGPTRLSTQAARAEDAARGQAWRAAVGDRRGIAARGVAGDRAS